MERSNSILDKKLVAVVGFPIQIWPIFQTTNELVV
jgi:hypothetical protein